MRVTQSMLSNNLLRNLNQSYAEMDKYFNQLNTGKKFNRPSDDPVAAMKGIGFRTELHQVKQYQRNTNEVHNWLDNLDSALDQVNSGLQRIRYLAVQASNGTYGESELKSIAAEVEQIKADLIETANMKVNDKYIFNGTNTNIPPVNVDAEPIVVEFDDSQVIIKVATNSELAANVDGNKVFMNGEESLFDTIDHFIAKLNGEIDEDMDESIADMDIFIDNVINSRADLGAKMNRLELIENRLAKQEIVATSTLSKNEDINYAETITNLITQESIHRAALSSGARIMQPTLLDFLR
ncbi:flagellar hook-associated protein FlgL [Oceanobacillus luteolus]|uniref:Flagellar hook-associated protein FlgL n=1 Tax=Oceanobacillus luteolus TaxID=1274358 RepID=A0ABW4HR88_9BACI